MSERLSFDHFFEEGDDVTKPVLLLLHGTGGRPADLRGLAAELSPGSAVLAPAGQVSENGMPRWFRRLGEGVFDYEDVVKRAGDLADFILDARAGYKLTGRRMVAVGFSNGANIAAAVALLRPDALTEAAAFAAMLPVPDPPAVDLSGTRVLLSNGTQDPMAPLPSTEQLVARLRERSADVTVHRHPGGHQITPEAVSQARAWLSA
ncbi:alpha/beta hydrolase [Kibdelosporangium phytohabitans]|uniref:Phospholipase n=1 Tax=Kibdelosporangium phytohabitans TaxID=860235 RepID=A0A0N9I7R8_9PSEU|nr:alpha/beta hydrolase [Kibdelosporangium phytohabitans]ALG10809.1 phospholipase [Kibdelosporangium phytohabitans]MBE1461977.1 phospholipase/carboxylesterase [Kibdelosporangium phytohabitans]